MKNSLFPLIALLSGSGFLFFAGGINGLILPVRGASEGFSTFSLGVLGTGWSVGYILGCIYAPRLVGKVGHVRSFSAMAAIASLSVLISALIISPIAWIILRSLAGFAFAGAAMIVEGWLTDKSDPKSRGTVFGIYTMVNLAASTMGQISLAVSGSIGFEIFILAGVFYSLALLPTAISASSTPTPITEAKLDIKALWKNSPIAIVVVLLVGVSNGAFGTLGAVYAKDMGLSLAQISFFMSAPILAGALAQVPVGYLSDHIDRRLVLFGIVLIAIGADAWFVFATDMNTTSAIIASALFGSSIFAMYPIMIAHANDHASKSSALKVSGGLLLMMGVGSIVGPMAAGVLMSMSGPKGLFELTLFAHLIIAIFVILRVLARTAVAQRRKGYFVFLNPTRGATPQTSVLSGQNKPKTTKPIDPNDKIAEKKN
jgi:MFS family permease